MNDFFRAVVWTDTLQFLLLMGGTIAIIIIGVMSVGGFVNVFEIADRGGRLIFFK